MSLVPTQHTICSLEDAAVQWVNYNSADALPIMRISLRSDELAIVFSFYLETIHSFSTDIVAQEYWMIPHFHRTIAVCPSEFLNRDATSIMQCPSGREMVNYINRNFPPPDKDERLIPVVVSKIIDLVQNSIRSEARGYIDVQQRNILEFMHHTNDIATRASSQGYFGATKRGTCAICIDDYDINFGAVRLPCLHVFHGPCICKWLMQTPRCPFCNYTSNLAQLKPWFNTPMKLTMVSANSVYAIRPKLTQELSFPKFANTMEVIQKVVKRFSATLSEYLKK